MLVGWLAALPLAAGQGAPVPQTESWTWVLGTLENEGEQARYTEYAESMHRYYQALGQLEGALTAEADLPQARPARLIWVGPLQAFAGRRWMPAVVERLDGHALRVAGKELRAERTGIYLRSEDGEQMMYSGLSLDGFRDIFSVPTGQRACTITVEGKLRFEGDWVDGKLVLQSVGFLTRYPSAEELKREPEPEKGVVLREVYREPGAGELTPEFRSRLAELVEGQRVLFVGESHWNMGVNRLFSEVLRELLESGGVGAVFLELSESYSGYFNHYVRMADEAEALAFLERELHPRVNVASVLQLLGMIRGWNLEHPGEEVEVVCHDMEWGVEWLVHGTLVPFFRGLDAKFAMAVPESGGGAVWRQDLARMRGLLELARERGYVGRYRFLTAERVGRMLTNLDDTLGLGKDVMVPRQRALVRNMVEFHGGAFGKGLAVFKVGGYHAEREAPMEEGTYREAAYLDRVHDETKGKVVALGLFGLGHGFGEVAGVDWSKRMRSATRYHRFINEFGVALAEGAASEGEFYLLSRGELAGVRRLVAGEGARRGRNVLWLEGGGAGGYDETVYVLRSQLEVTREVR